MKGSSSEPHLTPDQLVDLLDGAPVDAAVKQHLAGCQECAGELSVLEETLSQLHQDDVPHPGENYWPEFSSNLHRKLGKTPPGRKSVSWYWYVAAAAMLSFLSWQIVNSVLPERAEPLSVEVVLPAVEEDPEFLFLLSVVELSGWTEELEDSLGESSVLNLDPSQLTSEEAEWFRRELEEELRDDHEKS